MNIVVYCSSVDGLPLLWQQAADSVGRWIGAHKSQLVYGGVDAGLMRIVAKATKDSGGRTVGIVPSRRRECASPLNDVKVPTSDLNDRKGVMQMLGDIFVVLPGGYGTLDEFTTSFSYLNFTCQRRPIIIFNPDGLYDALLQQLQTMVSYGLLKPEALDIITVTDNIEGLMAALDKYNTKKS